MTLVALHAARSDRDGYDGWAITAFAGYPSRKSSRYAPRTRFVKITAPACPCPCQETLSE